MKQVLLYSKYSSHCKKLLSAMSKYGANISTVCIDNPKLRQKVMKDTRMRIKVVPTLLSVYPSGIIEKYEGERVFQLLLEAFESKPKMERVVPDFQKDLPPKPVEDDNAQKAQKVKKAKKAKKRTQLVDLDSDSDSEDLGSPQLSEIPETPGKIGERRDQGENLPIKRSSGLSGMVAEIQKQREDMDSSIPKPTQSNIRPYK